MKIKSKTILTFLYSVSPSHHPFLVPEKQLCAAMGVTQAFTGWGTLVYNVCQFLWCKLSHKGGFQATNMMSQAIAQHPNPEYFHQTIQQKSIILKLQNQGRRWACLALFGGRGQVKTGGGAGLRGVGVQVTDFMEQFHPYLASPAWKSPCTTCPTATTCLTVEAAWTSCCPFPWPRPTTSSWAAVTTKTFQKR